MKTKLKKFILCLFLGMGFIGSSLALNHVSANNFDGALSSSVGSIRRNLDAKIAGTDALKAESIVKKVVNVFFSVMVVVGVLVAMIGFYQILTSKDETKIKTGIQTMVYGVIGILIMYSAEYLTGVIFGIFSGGTATTLSTVEIIKTIYGDMVYPFIKIAIYLSLGILVLLMMSRVFTYITAQDEGTKKKSLGVIAWTTIGMLLITGAKQVVEAVYGKQEEVLKSAGNLSGIGTKIFDPADIPIVYNVINWALGLTAFVLLVMIIIQTYKILTKPDDASTFASLKKTIIYAIAGVLLIGAAYLLSNLFIIG